MQKHGGTLAPSTRPTVQPTHDRTLHAGSTHTPDVFFCQIQWRPKQTQKNTGKTKQSKHHPHKKTEKTLQNKPTNKQTQKNIACLIRNVVAHGFLFGIVDMVHFDLNFTIPWLKTLDI